MYNAIEELRRIFHMEGVGNLQMRKAAYNVAKSLKSSKEVAPLTKKLATRYFDLMHKSGSEGDRAGAARDLANQLEAEAEAATALERVMRNNMYVFSNVAGDHENTSDE